MRFSDLMLLALTGSAIASTGCSTTRAVFAVPPPDAKPSGGTIHNPFGDYYTNAKTDSSQNIVLRTKKGDRAVEIELPKTGEDNTDFIIPVSPAFQDNRRAPASADEDLKDYQNHAPTPADREITRAFSQGGLGEEEGRRREIELGLGLMPAEDTVPAAQGSYLGSLDHVKTLYRRGRFEAALVEVEALTRQYPTDPKLYQMRGTLLDRLGQPELAFKSWSQALRFDPQNATLRRFVERKQQLQKRSVASP